VIRFSAFLVVVAVGLLVAGVVTSKLALVYIAIGVSGVALLALGIGLTDLNKTEYGSDHELSAQAMDARALHAKAEQYQLEQVAPGSTDKAKAVIAAARAATAARYPPPHSRRRPIAARINLQGIAPDQGLDRRE